jgi:predicted phosphodiesterase
MKILKLLQIGDIHYPDTREAQLIDFKDRSFPADLIEKISPIPFQSVLRNIISICSKGVDGLLFNGDFTSKGDLVSYKKCLKLLEDSLKLNKWNRQNIHAVLGNHDILRHKNGIFFPSSNQLQKNSHFYSKFEPFLNDNKLFLSTLMKVHSYRKTTVSNRNVKANVFSLNSCLGCGEIRFFPEKIRSEILSAINKLIKEDINNKKKDNLDEVLNLLYEELDTPAFLEEDIDEVCNDIKNNSDKQIAIVVAHHNILPMVKLRINLYAEAINSGLIRKRFSSLNIPVVYCHGHTHNNQIDFIVSDDNSKSKLLTISSPLITDGFNMIKIIYGYKKVPIGVEVELYNLDDNSMVNVSKINKYSFFKPAQLQFYGDDRILNLLNILSCDYMRYPDIYKNFKINNKRIHKKTLNQLLLEAEWFQVIEIQNKEYEPNNWQIRRVIPCL